ncbi:MAG: inositol monophosphatase family protein [Alphaproteobacteria bacterium]
MARQSPHIYVMVRAAQKAGRGLIRDFGEIERLQVSEKGPANFVSIADTRAERVIREELTRARPGFGLLMEESGETAGTEPGVRWIVDPLDGTTNFLHGIPYFAISIAIERDGEIVAGVVHDPIRDETFWADKGQGAFLNDERIRVSGRRRIGDAVVTTGIPHRGRGDHAVYLPQLQRVMASVAGIRRMGAAALDLAYVAAGRYDAFWEDWLAPWDLAAGLLLVREAGGFVSDLSGGSEMMRTGGVIAANQHLLPPLTALLRTG